MRIEQVTVRHLVIPFKHHFTTSFGQTEKHHTMVVEARADGLVAYTETTPFFAPIYCLETADSPYLALRDHILPSVVGTDFTDAQTLMDALAWIRGNEFPKSAIEMVFWSLLAQAAEQPLHRFLGGTNDEIPAGE